MKKLTVLVLMMSLLGACSNADKDDNIAKEPSVSPTEAKVSIGVNISEEVSENKAGTVPETKDEAEEEVADIEPFTDKELQDMASVDQAIRNLIESKEFIAMNKPERINASKELLKSLESQELLYDIFYDGADTVGFTYKSGVPGGIYLILDGEYSLTTPDGVQIPIN